jgi:hypothetical protein
MLVHGLDCNVLVDSIAMFYSNYLFSLLLNI